jgi:hypothetical protein
LDCSPDPGSIPSNPMNEIGRPGFMDPDLPAGN